MKHGGDSGPDSLKCEHVYCDFMYFADILFRWNYTFLIYRSVILELLNLVISSNCDVF